MPHRQQAARRMARALDQDRRPMASAGGERGGRHEANVQSEGTHDWATDPKAKPLTRRKAQIVRLVATGLADKQIAADLGISEETVAYHLRAMFAHHGVHCRAALVARLGPTLRNP